MAGSGITYDDNSIWELPAACRVTDISRETHGCNMTTQSCTLCSICAQLIILFVASPLDMHCIRHLFYIWLKYCSFSFILIYSDKQSPKQRNHISSDNNMHMETCAKNHIATPILDTYTRFPYFFSQAMRCILLFRHLWSPCLMYLWYSFLRSPSCRRKATDLWILGRQVSCVLRYFMLLSWWNYFKKYIYYFIKVVTHSSENLQPI